jgi:large repetitive protein
VQILNNTITGNSNGIQLKAGQNIKLSGNTLDNIGENFTAAPGVTYTDFTVSLEYSTTAPTNEDVIAALVSNRPFTVTNNSGSPTYSFTENGSFTFEYADEDGNEGTMTATVSNIDKIAPVLKVTLSPSVLKAPNHKMVDIRASLESSDEGSGVASIVLTSITMESADGKGHSGDIQEILNGKDKDTGKHDSNNKDKGGKSGPDIQDAEFGTRDTHFRLRADKSARGQSRIYTVTYTVTDHAGNQAQAVGKVRVK